MLLNEYQFLIPGIASHNQMFSLDATRCLEGGKLDQIEVSDIFGVEVATRIITGSLPLWDILSFLNA